MGIAAMFISEWHHRGVEAYRREAGHNQTSQDSGMLNLCRLRRGTRNWHQPTTSAYQGFLDGTEIRSEDAPKK